MMFDFLRRKQKKRSGRQKGFRPQPRSLEDRRHGEACILASIARQHWGDEMTVHQIADKADDVLLRLHGIGPVRLAYFRADYEGYKQRFPREAFE